MPSLFGIGIVVLEKQISKSWLFLFFPNYLPLGMAWPFIRTNLKPLHPEIRCARFSWKCQSGSGEEAENVKMYRRTDRRTERDRQTSDDRWSDKLTWAFSLGELIKNGINKSEKYNSILLIRYPQLRICQWMKKNPPPPKKKEKKRRKITVS